ncbi:hypothetical protein Tco_0079976 [Tanacetum coccineum]
MISMMLRLVFPPRRGVTDWKRIFKKRNKKKAKNKQNQARNGKDKVEGNGYSRKGTKKKPKHKQKPKHGNRKETDIQKKKQKRKLKTSKTKHGIKGEVEATVNACALVLKLVVYDNNIDNNNKFLLILLKLPKIRWLIIELWQNCSRLPTRDNGGRTIVVPEIEAANFEIKHGLLTLVQNKQFFGHDKEDPHAHIRYFNKITSTLRYPNVPTTHKLNAVSFFSLEGVGSPDYA